MLKRNAMVHAAAMLRDVIEATTLAPALTSGSGGVFARCVACAASRALLRLPLTGVCLHHTTSHMASLIFNICAGAYSNGELVPKLGTEVMADASVDMVDCLLVVLEDRAVQVCDYVYCAVWLRVWLCVCDAGWAMECGRVGLIVSASPPASHGYRRPHRRYVT